MARATPRRRHGRRTLICSSQPRRTPSRSFSSAQIQVWTTPAISSPSQATTQRSVSSSALRTAAGTPPRHSRAVLPVVPERLELGVEDRTMLVGSTGRNSSPSGSGASGMSSNVGRRMKKNQRIDRTPGRRECAGGPPAFSKRARTETWASRRRFRCRARRAVQVLAQHRAADPAGAAARDQIARTPRNRPFPPAEPRSAGRRRPRVRRSRRR